jgi:signal transduction histidine kinase
MLGLVETSKQRAPIVAAGSAAEALRPATPLENWQRRRSIAGPLSAAIIHDLRNPMAAICASAEMLTSPHLTSDHADRLRRSIHRSAGQMRELLDELAGVAQGKLEAVENCSLQEILAAACDDAADAANNQGIDILVDLPARMEVMLARARMERVFIDLITNALEAMPRGGKIRISGSKVGGLRLSRLKIRGLVSLLRFTTGYLLRLSPRARRTAWDWDWRSRARRSASTAATCGSNPPAVLDL